MSKQQLCFILCLLATCSNARATTINEVRIDDPGADNNEYFELAGTPGDSLDGLFYIVIGDGTGGSGVLERVIDLSGLTIPDDGFFLAANDGIGTEDEITIPSPVSIDLSLGSNTFENSDNVTHLLVTGLTASQGDDLDVGDTGVLDTPFTVVDGFSLLESETDGEILYADQFGLPTIGPAGIFVPGHVFRLPDGGGDFVIGDFAGDTADTPGISNVAIPEPNAFVLALFAATAASFRRHT